jgi:hypothetical protein
MDVGGLVSAAAERKFAALPTDEQRVILAEHGAIGMSAAPATRPDVPSRVPRPRQDRQRLHRRPIGKDLYPLSALSRQ